MGMYTQYRGWICLDSIHGNHTDFALKTMKTLKERFKERADLDRTWVADDCWILPGSNGSLWLFFGTEHKNYDKSMDAWIETVVKAFPKCEGRIDVQYEETYEGEQTRCLFIAEGKITEKSVTAWTKGYGLDWAIDPQAANPREGA